MENRTKLFILTLLFFCISRTYAGQIPALNSRLIILADMGNEPDEMQQMVHMIMCSNEFELEGLIAVTGKYLRPESGNPYKQKLHPELFINLINGYAWKSIVKSIFNGKVFNDEKSKKHQLVVSCC